MKYHYQKGIVQKDKRGHRKGWLGFFIIFTVVAYSGFLFAVLSLNGWPVADVATSANAVKNLKPSSNKLFIPAINLVADNGNIKIKGDPSYMDVTVTGPTLGFGVTPNSLRQASLFFNVDELKMGDEIFLDNQGTRYVYKVAKSVSQSDQKLTIQNSKKTIVAKTVGTISWDDGKPTLESF